jgi:hypothetical protein
VRKPNLLEACIVEGMTNRKESFWKLEAFACFLGSDLKKIDSMRS